MTPLAGQPILTAAAMRAAEQAEIDRGATVESLMARAGAEVAQAVHRLGSGTPVLVLCGPGNNGGDGYVAATALKAAGMTVRVAASGPPVTEAARRARAGWGEAVEDLEQAEGAPVLLDGLFGTGLARPLAPALSGPLMRLVGAARLSIAIDLPSGVTTDDGAVLGDVPQVDVTLALGAAKPSHLLQPAARHCGTVRVLDIGIPVASPMAAITVPALRDPGPDSHKYNRGMVAVIGGGMTGAGELAALAAMRAGAGYVLLLGAGVPGTPHALVRAAYDSARLADERIGALVVGPGLGRGADALARLDDALGRAGPLVIDGDALHLLDEHRQAGLRGRRPACVLTPHAGEFAALFGPVTGSKIEAARRAAKHCGAVIMYKGADTVIAAPDGRVCISGDASDWLSTAGTGDVLAGAVGAMLASGLDPFDAASAGAWLHGDAARRLGAAFIADDLANLLCVARAAL